MFDLEGPSKGYNLQEVVERWSEETGLSIDDTYTVSTEGGGLHAYYSIPNGEEIRSARNYIEGCDIKALGGYVVGPRSAIRQASYSVHGERPCRELGGPALDRVARHSRSVSQDRQVSQKPASPDRNGAAQYLQIAEAAIEGCGGDEHTNRVLWNARRFGIDADECLALALTHFNPRCEPPWNESELGYKVENAYKNSNIGYIDSDPEATFGDMVEKPKPSKFYPYTISELDGFEPMKWVIKNTIPSRGLGLLIGPYDTYKSFLAIDLACSVATGEGWAGRQNVLGRGNAIYVAGEDPSDILLRTKAWADRMKAELSDHLRIVQNMPHFNEKDQIAEFLGEIKPHEPDLIVIDTFGRALSGADENSSKDIAVFIQTAEFIQKQTGAFVLAIHHTGKDKAKGARGHSKLPAEADVEFVIESDPDVHEAYLTLKRIKRASKWDKTEVFSGEMIEMGKDESGDSISTLAFRHDKNKVFTKAD